MQTRILRNKQKKKTKVLQNSWGPSIRAVKMWKSKKKKIEAEEREKKSEKLHFMVFAFCQSSIAKHSHTHIHTLSRIHTNVSMNANKQIFLLPLSLLLSLIQLLTHWLAHVNK